MEEEKDNLLMKSLHQCLMFRYFLVAINIDHYYSDGKIQIEMEKILNIWGNLSTSVMFLKDSMALKS